MVATVCIAVMSRPVGAAGGKDGEKSARNNGAGNIRRRPSRAFSAATCAMKPERGLFYLVIKTKKCLISDQEENFFRPCSGNFQQFPEQGPTENRYDTVQIFSLFFGFWLLAGCTVDPGAEPGLSGKNFRLPKIRMRSPSNRLSKSCNPSSKRSIFPRKMALSPAAAAYGV